jgi:hypothetical protein
MKRTTLALVAAIVLTATTANAQSTQTLTQEEILGQTELSVRTSSRLHRWITFFGFKICTGQVVVLPGETQCV